MNLHYIVKIQSQYKISGESIYFFFGTVFLLNCKKARLHQQQGQNFFRWNKTIKRCELGLESLQISTRHVLQDYERHISHIF